MSNLAHLRILCISASNNFRSGIKETCSYQICKTVSDEAKKHIADIEGEIVELKNLTLSPCRDCMNCLDSRRCATDDSFNRLYEKIIACDILMKLLKPPSKKLRSKVGEGCCCVLLFLPLYLQAKINKEKADTLLWFIRFFACRLQMDLC